MVERGDKKSQTPRKVQDRISAGYNLLLVLATL